MKGDMPTVQKHPVAGYPSTEEAEAGGLGIRPLADLVADKTC